jgi:large subunit ribosomal protein L9
MKVIFLKNITGKARVGDIKEVPIGYANNYLLPNNLAIAATPGALKEAALKAAQQKELAIKETVRLKEVAEKIKNLTLNFTLKFSSNTDDNTKEVLSEKAYDSVNAQRITDALISQGIDVNRNQVVLEKPIKTVGVFEVEIKLLPQTKTFLKINITSASKNTL